jgi:ubiquinone/menaquinone biosynthesis C-methylase UbiE
MKISSWDKRNVFYENIHSVNPNDMEILLKSIQLNEGETFLDIGCGYGSVTRKLFEIYGKSYAKILLLDYSSKQLEKTNDLDVEKRIKQDITNIYLDTNSIDKAIAKMCIHEMNYFKQQEAIDNIYRVLKQGGIFSIWDTALKNEVEQHYFHRIIGEKDRLSGFDNFILDRYFPIIGNLISMVSRSGFTLINYHPVQYILSTKKRLKEIGGPENLNKWHQYIRKISNEDLINRFKVKDFDNTIQMKINKGIYVFRK